MDRNRCGGIRYSHAGVALRKESVDRNVGGLWVLLTQIWVALRKESVDRNGLGVAGHGKGRLSLSARRAWIEI